MCQEMWVRYDGSGPHPQHLVRWIRRLLQVPGPDRATQQSAASQIQLRMKLQRWRCNKEWKQFYFSGNGSTKSYLDTGIKILQRGHPKWNALLHRISLTNWFPVKIQIIVSVLLPTSMIPTKALSGCLNFYFKHYVIMYKFLETFPPEEELLSSFLRRSGREPSVWERKLEFTGLPEDPSLNCWSVKQLLGEENYPPSTDLRGLRSYLQAVHSSGLQTSLGCGTTCRLCRAPGCRPLWTAELRAGCAELRAADLSGLRS